MDQVVAKADDSFEWAGPSGRLGVRLYLPEAQRSPDLLVFFPPGGFVELQLDAADGCLKTLALACKAPVLAASYALAPKHPFPAAVEDAHALLLGVSKRRPSVRGWSGERLFVVGIEAGGNLAAVSALMCRDRLGPKLAGQVLVMPMLDPSMRACSQAASQDAVQAIGEAYRGYLPRASDRVHPYACPLESSRLAGLPPALLVHTEADPLAAEGLAYADKLERSGIAVRRVALPPGELNSAEERCRAAEDSPCIAAIAEFIASAGKPGSPSC